MWPKEEKTQILLDNARNGDSAAVNELLARHREAVRNLISMRLDPLLVRRLDASDIVQEVLLEASRRLADYLKDPVMPFHLWLRHLAKDHIIDAHRRHRLARKRSLDRERPLAKAALADQSSISLASQLVSQGMTPTAAALRRELEQRFITALEALNDDDQEMILMRHFEQLSNQEVAKALNLTEPAASMRYLRALRRLRAILGEDQETET